MNFLFGLRFNMFDMIVNGIIMFLIIDTNSYWWLLLLIPTMFVSVYAERKLEVIKFLERHGIK